MAIIDSLKSIGKKLLQRESFNSNKTNQHTPAGKHNRISLKCKHDHVDYKTGKKNTQGHSGQYWI